MRILLFSLLYLGQDLTLHSAAAAKAMREQRYADAVDIYRGLTQKDAANPMWQLNLGMALFYAGGHAEAARELSAYLRVRPQPGAAHLFLGISKLKLHQACEAIAPLETALRWPERPTNRWTELADAYQGCKRWEPAAKAYTEAAKADPADFQILRQAAHCWRMAHRYDLAKPVFAALQAKYQGNAESQFEYGDTLLRLEGAVEGLSLLVKAVAIDPNLGPARGALGRALMDLERPKDAISHLEAGAAHDRTLLLALSRAYQAVGRSAEAAKAVADYQAAMLALP